MKRDDTARRLTPGDPGQNRQSEATYRELFEQSSEAMVLVELGGRILEVNPAWLDMVGYTREEALDLDIRDVYADPSDLDHLLRRMEESAVVRDEVRYRRKDGAIIECRRSVVARRNERGETIAFQSLVLDIAEQKRTQRELLDNEEKFRALFTDSPLSIIIHDQETGEIVDANPKAIAAYGLSSLEELRSVGTWSDPPYSYEEAMEWVRKAATEGPQEFEWLSRKVTGEVFWEQVRLVPVTFGKVLRMVPVSLENVQRVLSTSTDISGLKSTEMALHASEERYRQLFEQAMDAVFVVRTDGSGIEANQAWLDMLGYTREDLATLRAQDLYADPADRERFLRRMDENGFARDEVKLKRKDGTIIECDQAVIAIKDTSGKTVAFHGMWRDVTERKRTEEALRERENRFRILFEQSTDAIWMTRLNGTIIDANEAWLRLFGYTTEDLQHVTVHDLYANAADREMFLQDVLASGELKDEVQFKRKDGTVIVCERSSIAVGDESGETVQFQSVIRDISERIRAQHELEASRTLLQQVLQGTLDVIQQMTEARDPYTSGHQRRVAELAEAIAREMHLPEDSCVAVVRTAAFIHDIGKITVPAEILSKPGQLSTTEFELIKVHPTTGYNILRRAHLPEPVAETVLQHHERLDGSGYPQQLKGDDILPEAQILAVADVVEAMSSHRPYRPAPGIEAALEEICSGSGTRYYPDVVTTCVKLFREKGFTFSC